MSEKQIQVGTFWVSVKAENFEAVRLSDFNQIARECNSQADQLAALREELGQCKGEYDRAVNRVSALQDELDACGDMTFTEWMNEHGKEAMSHELGVEELMEGAFECGAKSMRRHLKQRLADAERRNAISLELLHEVQKAGRKQAWAHGYPTLFERIDAALNPNPEAASHD